MPDAVFSQRELLADPELAQPGFLLQPRHEVLGRPPRELQGEGDDDDLVETGLGQLLHLLFRRRDAAGERLGPEHRRRNRLESDAGYGEIELSTTLHRLVEKAAMTAVDAVEGADRDDALAGGQVVGC